MHAAPLQLHRAPDPVPVDEPLQDPFDNPHPHHPPVHLPDADDDPVPDHKPMVGCWVDQLQRQHPGTRFIREH